MGSFFLTSKKASATLVFLVISILLVSSGVIIVHEVEKSNNENNIAETGLVLLDNEQNNLDALSDSSDDGTKLFTFGDSRGKTSPKKSSGGGGGSSGEEPSTASEVSNDLILPEMNETSDNQTFVNDTEEEDLNSSESFVNDTEEENLNSSESTNISAQFSDGQIFEQNGTTYIMRDGAAYALASSDYYIEFDPALPSSVCGNEGINITVKGKARFYPDFEDSYDCARNGYAYVTWCINLMEDDGILPDDLVDWDCDLSKSYNCESFYFEEDLLNVDLSDFIISDPGGNGEFYVKIYDFNNKVGGISTSSYDVYGYVNDECDCLSGACCDLSSRPYEFKPYPSQPTDYTDEYICSAVNSPMGTNYCVERDFYCSGNSASYSYSSSNVDTCGICEYCTPGDSTCNYYSSSYSCGTKDCDYLSTTCRNYNDVSKYCSSGRCISPSCTSYTNANEGTYCGTNNECDGSGTCITCKDSNYNYCYNMGENLQSYFWQTDIKNKCKGFIGCSNDDVYWYDACDNKNEKQKECGEDWCSSTWEYYCNENDRWKKRRCQSNGCSNTEGYSNCYTISWEDSQFVETCQYGCINGICQSDPDIACYSNGDCGQNGFSGNPYCYDDDIYDWFREYICHYQGTEQSFCSDEGHGSMIQDCPEDSYSENYCYDDDVYQNFTDRGCSNGVCFENITEQFVQECGAEGCLNGECLYVECYEDNECGINHYVENPLCQEDNAWQNYLTYTCNNQGTGNSYCSNSTALELKENCGSDYCENWGSNYCNLDDLYHERTCHDKGCSSGACFDNIDTEEEKVQECGTSEYTGNNYCYSDDVYRDYITRTCSDSSCTSSTSKKKIEDCTNGCTDGKCLIEVCKTICNFGTCYEYCVW